MKLVCDAVAGLMHEFISAKTKFNSLNLYLAKPDPTTIFRRRVWLARLVGMGIGPVFQQPQP